MAKVCIQTISLNSMPKILCQIEVAQKKEENQALGKVCQKDVAQAAQLEQKISIDKSFQKLSGTNGIKARLPVLPVASIEIPPTFLCVKRDKGFTLTSIIKPGTLGTRLLEAVKFLRQKTAILPGWAKRRCRRQAIAIFDRFWKAGEEQFFDRLRNAVKDWKKVPWNSLPADLPKKAGETSDQWLDRCYKAAGFGTIKDITIGGIKT
jgi:hypothetical protein